MRKVIVHFFPKEKFTSDFINFTNDYMSENIDHIFFIYGSDNFNNLVAPLKKYDNVKDLKINRRLISILARANQIVFHSFFFQSKYYILFCLWMKIFSKATWVIWGGDLYDIRDRATIKRSIRVFLKKKILSRVRNIAVLTDADYNFAQRWYRVSGGKYLVRYIDYETNDFLNSLDNSKEEKNKKIFLVGNSATQTNRHKEVFELLAKYSDDDFEVIVPLSYGDDNYKRKVIEEGCSLLENKFIPLTSFINKEDYYRLLSTVDVAFFNNSRQQGLGNIRVLMKFGAKIYMDKNGPMYNDMMSDYNISTTQSMNGQSFIELTAYEEKERLENEQRVAEYFTTKKAIEEWMNLFENGST